MPTLSEFVRESLVTLGRMYKIWTVGRCQRSNANRRKRVCSKHFLDELVIIYRQPFESFPSQLSRVRIPSPALPSRGEGRYLYSFGDALAFLRQVLSAEHSCRSAVALLATSRFAGTTNPLAVTQTKPGCADRRVVSYQPANPNSGQAASRRDDFSRTSKGT